MKNLRRKFNRFCFQHRDKGIPNLMLYIILGNAIVYFFTMFTGNPLLYNLLVFDRTLIFRGQVWRLITYPLTAIGGNVAQALIAMICYYSLGTAVENTWGTFRFNLYYLTGIVLMDLFAILVGMGATASYLNLSLVLAYATLYPNAHFLLFYVIPIKAWILALVYLGLTFYDVLKLSIPYFLFPFNLYPLIALANYFLFFGKDIANVIPLSWKANFTRLGRKTAPKKPGHKTIPFPTAGSYQATHAKPTAPYNHKCTVCGRTDIDHPELEFRYCSRCKGYYCYCQDHISNHNHIQ